MKDKIIVVDYEYKIIPEDLHAIGEVYRFTIASYTGITLLNITEYKNEIELIQDLFHRLNSFNTLSVYTHFLEGLMRVIKCRSEALGVSIKELIDPDNLYKEKVNINILKTHTHGEHVYPLKLEEFVYNITLPANFKFMDMITLSSEVIKNPDTWTLSNIAKHILDVNIEKSQPCSYISLDQSRSDIEIIYRIVKKLKE